MKTPISSRQVSPDNRDPALEVRASFTTGKHRGEDGLYGLQSKWPITRDLGGSTLPCRLEGEVEDLVILGEVPKQINGTFYRVMVDPFVPPHPNNVPVDGDGNISAFRFHDGHVDMKTRYVETERFKLERKAKKALFGLYRNPYTHHPCVRAAVDSTANTNLVLWADKLLALKEVALPYYVDPISLETLGYDPFPNQVKSKTFTAHPKVDPYTDEMVVFGYEAKGLATLDVVCYTLDNKGVKTEELWLKAPWCSFIHDCAITSNFLILSLWPFEASIDRMKAGGHHWAWSYDRPTTFLLVPRRPKTNLPKGWKEGEHRVYTWKNCMAMHTAGAWEAPDGKVYFESSRVMDNGFPFFPPDDGRMPNPITKGDFVRWELDPSQPSGSAIKDPQVILNMASEFPRIDERFMTKEYEYVFVPVFIPDLADMSKNVYQGLNGLAMHSHKTGVTKFFYAGDESFVQEPVFVPRSDDAPEGDGWVISMVERKNVMRCDLVVLDTRHFETPIAIVQLPFHMKGQIHGNWVESVKLGHRSIVRDIGEVKVSGRGALELE